jgi:hypothetical protein
VNEQVLESLLPSPERLRQLRDEFGPMARVQEWIIYCFQEDHGIRVLDGRKVGNMSRQPILLANILTMAGC